MPLLALFQPAAQAQSAAATQVTSGGYTRLPVEVVSKDGAESQSQWVLVEVSGQAIPEPEAAALLLLAGLLLIRRSRG